MYHSFLPGTTAEKKRKSTKNPAGFWRATASCGQSTPSAPRRGRKGIRPIPSGCRSCLVVKIGSGGRVRVEFRPGGENVAANKAPYHLSLRKAGYVFVLQLVGLIIFSVWIIDHIKAIFVDAGDNQKMGSSGKHGSLLHQYDDQLPLFQSFPAFFQGYVSIIGSIHRESHLLNAILHTQRRVVFADVKPPGHFLHGIIVPVVVAGQHGKAGNSTAVGMNDSAAKGNHHICLMKQRHSLVGVRLCGGGGLLRGFRGRSRLGGGRLRLRLCGHRPRVGVIFRKRRFQTAAAGQQQAYQQQASQKGRVSSLSQFLRSFLRLFIFPVPV